MSLNRNKAVGIDEVSWEEYGENLVENLEQLVGRLKAKKYKPIPARRVYIPKNDTEKRPLGISALENSGYWTSISLDLLSRPNITNEPASLLARQEHEKPLRHC